MCFAKSTFVSFLHKQVKRVLSSVAFCIKPQTWAKTESLRVVWIYASMHLMHLCLGKNPLRHKLQLCERIFNQEKDEHEHHNRSKVMLHTKQLPRVLAWPEQEHSNASARCVQQMFQFFPFCVLFSLICAYIMVHSMLSIGILIFSFVALYLIFFPRYPH